MRYIERFLGKLKGVLTHSEKSLLYGYDKGAALCYDVLLNILLSPVLQECGHASPLLVLEDRDCIELASVMGKVLYKNLVKVLNKNVLKNRSDNVWRARLNIDDETKPVWRVIYKPPITKRTGDLQWRILHGAVNAVVSVINPALSDKCPFCTARETIYHCFMECNRLSPLFDVLSTLFFFMGMVFTKLGFILGSPYNQKQRSKCQLINFIVGQAKLAVYISRKNRVGQKVGDDDVLIFKNLVRARITIDFYFFKLMSAIDVFEDKWCCDGALCTVSNEEIVFAPFLTT